MYDTPGQRELPRLESPVALMETLLVQAIAEPTATAVVKTRGRPARLSTQLLAAGIVWCLLHGWVSQWDLWRRISCFGVGSLPAVAVCDQAIYNRLAKSGTAVMQSWCAQVSSWLWHWMAPYEDQHLAPFATQIFALDESTMDAVHRWLQELRGVPLGDRWRLGRTMSGALCYPAATMDASGLATGGGGQLPGLCPADGERPANRHLAAL